jgi:DNA-binding transcriptional ArsR family regulator
VTTRADPLGSVFGALADPTRRAILARLAESGTDLPVNELQRPFQISQPAISRHLKVLERAGLITRSRRSTARLSRFEAEPLREASDWLARYRALWEERFGRLDALLTQLQQPDQDRAEPMTPGEKEHDHG